MASSCVVVYVTAPKGRVAKKISAFVVRERLAACVNIVPSVESIYRWKGKVETAKESLLVMKTTKSKFPKLAKLVKTIHPYDVPEIIALPIAHGHSPYLKWISDETKGSGQ